MCEVTTTESIGELLADALRKALAREGVNHATAAKVADVVRTSGNLSTGVATLVSLAKVDRATSYRRYRRAVDAIAADATLLSDLRARRAAQSAGRQRIPIIGQIARQASKAIITDWDDKSGARVRNIPTRRRKLQSEEVTTSEHERWVKQAMGDAYEPPLDVGTSERSDTTAERLAMRRGTPARMTAPVRPMASPHTNGAPRVGALSDGTNRGPDKDSTVDVDRNRRIAKGRAMPRPDFDGTPHDRTSAMYCYLADRPR